MASNKHDHDVNLSDSEEESNTQDERDKIELLWKQGHTAGAAGRALEVFKDKTTPDLPKVRPVNPPPSHSVTMQSEIINAPTTTNVREVKDRMILITIDFIKLKFGDHQLGQMIIGAEGLFPADLIEEILVGMRKPMRETDMIRSLQSASFGLWNLISGYHMGQNKLNFRSMKRLRA